MASGQQAGDRSNAAPRALRFLEERGQDVDVPLAAVVDALYGVLAERDDEPARAVVQVIAGHVLAHVEDPAGKATGRLGPGDEGAAQDRSTGGDAEAAASIAEREAVASDRDDMFGR